jgi:hypothetical protein
MATSYYAIITDLPSNQVFIQLGINGDFVPIGYSINLTQGIITNLISKMKSHKQFEKTENL